MVAVIVVEYEHAIFARTGGYDEAAGVTSDNIDDSRIAEMYQQWAQGKSMSMLVM